MLSVSSLLILIVEDESLIGLDVQDGLELAGFQTVFVACPLEAAALLEAEKSNFAGLVTDIRLGSRMTGWDLALVARGQKDNFPVVYMSGDSARDHCVFGVANSVMLQKPFESGRVVSAMCALLNAQAEPPETGHGSTSGSS